MLPDSITKLVAQLAEKLTKRNATITTVESCTGGGISYALTHVPGSSVWFERGFVTYSNSAKSEWVGVSMDLIIKYGAVSNQVAREMALGGRSSANADYGISVTGIAGPGGGSDDKPVGTVCFGWAGPDALIDTKREVFQGDRASIRQQSISYALQGILERID